jgi:hypothetical protein
VSNYASPAADAFYLNKGGGQFTRITEGAWVNDRSPGNPATWADYDNDGHVDLYVGNINTSAFLWKNDGQGGMTLVTGTVTSTLNSMDCSWADYDNDGDPDLFVSCDAAPNLLFENQGDGTFLRVLTGPPVDVIAHSLAVAWGDYDNDGHFDLFVATGYSSPEADLLYRNNGDRTFTRILNGSPVDDTVRSWGAAWGDYDNDGYLDLFVANQQGPNLLYHNERIGRFSQVFDGEVVSDAGHHGPGAWADFDNDGSLDLLVCHIDISGGGLPEPNSLYRNQGNSNAWIMVRLVGTVSNRAAIGAKVRVHATIWGKSVWQLRQISGGEGACQGDLRTHFGLGDATKVDTLRIEWPSGTVQELHNVPVKQILSITEPAKLVPVSSRGFQIRCWKGMQFEVQRTHDLLTWDSLGMVTNLTGTLTFQDTQGGPGTASCFYRVVSR